MALEPITLSEIPLGELYRLATILNCERMLYARPKDVEAEIDSKIAELETEIERRKAAS
jgi:hypothetical protein